MIRELVFLLEERSAKVMLESLLPRILNSKVNFRLIAFEGKQDLEKKIVSKIRSYINPSARFIVMRDLDSAPDCLKLKQKLLGKCIESGRGGDSLVRIACRELESFYLADLLAVEKALGLRGIADKQNIAKFRRPDILVSPSVELKQLTKNGYEKISGSRLIGLHLDPANLRSESFGNLIDGIKRLEGELLAL